MKTHKLKYLTIGHIEQIKKLWVPGKDTFSDKEAFTRSLDEEQLIELFYISGDWTYEEAEEEVMAFVVLTFLIIFSIQSDRLIDRLDGIVEQMRKANDKRA